MDSTQTAPDRGSEPGTATAAENTQQVELTVVGEVAHLRLTLSQYMDVMRGMMLAEDRARYLASEHRTHKRPELAESCTKAADRFFDLGHELKTAYNNRG